MFKSDEEKAVEKAERERVEAARQKALADERAAAEKARAEDAYRQGPIGQASTAKQAGLRFFEVQLDVGESQRTATFGATSGTESRSTQHLGTLGEIEALGWQLENVGYIFQVTGEETTDKFITTGQRVAVSGKTVGIYLFRNPD